MIVMDAKTHLKLDIMAKVYEGKVSVESAAKLLA